MTVQFAGSRDIGLHQNTTCYSRFCAMCACAHGIYSSGATACLYHRERVYTLIPDPDAQETAWVHDMHGDHIDSVDRYNHDLYALAAQCPEPFRRRVTPLTSANDVRQDRVLIPASPPLQACWLGTLPLRHRPPCRGYPRAQRPGCPYRDAGSAPRRPVRQAEL